MDEELEIVRGKQAHGLLQNDLLVEALAAIEMKYENIWINSKPSESTLREAAYQALYSAREFKQHLTRFVESGKLASVAKETRLEADEVQRRVDAWDGSTDGRT